MVGKAVGIALCVLLWGARVYVRAKYRVRYRAAGKVQWLWKEGTPDWTTRVAPWLEFVSWVAFLALLAWLALDPVTVKGA